MTHFETMDLQLVRRSARTRRHALEGGKSGYGKTTTSWLQDVTEQCDDGAQLIVAEIWRGTET
jgi:hypothetical protein